MENLFWLMLRLMSKHSEHSSTGHFIKNHLFAPWMGKKNIKLQFDMLNKKGPKGMDMDFLFCLTIF